MVYGPFAEVREITAHLQFKDFSVFQPIFLFLLTTMATEKLTPLSTGRQKGIGMYSEVP